MINFGQSKNKIGMKKFFILVIFLLAYNYLFAQNKPTKQEIVSWISSKINAQISDRQWFNSNGKKFFYQYYKSANELGFSMSDSDGTNGFPKNMDVYFSNICSANGVKNEPAICVHLKRPITRSYNDGSGAESVDQVYIYMNWDLETNLLDRIKKAFNDLGSYNCPPVKEVY